MRHRLAIAILAVAAIAVPVAADPPQAAAAPDADVSTARELHDPVAVEDDGYVPPARLQEGWYARIETDRGRIVAMLLPEQAPQSVAHFAALAQGRLAWTDPVTGEVFREPYYDGIAIHKAEAGRLIEAGDRHGTGNGAPLMYVPREGLGPVTFHSPGRLGMTAAPGGKISAVQFFATYAAQPWLTDRHPCFGVIVEGREVVFELSSVKTYSNGRPVEPVRITKVRIFAVGEPPPLPTPEEYWPPPQKFELRETPADADRR